MRDSIVIDMKYADYDMIDGSYGVERHHLIGGPNRSKADEDGLWCPLSPSHHNSSKMSVHQNKEMKVMSHIIAQLAYEVEMLSTGKAKTKEEAKELFRRRYGKTYV
ncbi:MAG: hypothetical protein KBT03_00705 [Bacteroidales bacterium]|nr:hypothetical protein [Candidatus Scybalousia scybalohippi]